MAKSFRQQLDNPAMTFISSAPIKEEASPGEAPATAYRDRRHAETRSKRLQVLLPPSVFMKLRDKADVEGISVNELINIILTDAL